jgi:hypothetical protein
LRDQAIQDLPFVQDYRLNTTPWVRGWERGKDSDLSVEDGPDGRALRWTTELADGQTDFLAFGFDTDRDRVSSISLSVRSEDVPAKVRVVLEDSDGQLWMSSKQTVRMGRWTELTLPIADFTSTGETKPLDARTLRSLTFQDLTALHTNSRGSNTIWIDDLTVR